MMTHVRFPWYENKTPPNRYCTPRKTSCFRTRPVDLGFFVQKSLPCECELRTELQVQKIKKSPTRVCTYLYVKIEPKF